MLPPGFIPGNFSQSDAKKAEGDKNPSELAYESAMALAQAPGKALLMNAFMLWMSGSTLQIFSIMMVAMSLWRPFSALFSVNQQFARYAASNVNMTLPKLIYLVLNMVGVGIALYKCQTLGILPNASDWAFVDVVRSPAEFSGGGIIY